MGPKPEAATFRVTSPVMDGTHIPAYVPSLAAISGETPLSNKLKVESPLVGLTTTVAPVTGAPQSLRLTDTVVFCANDAENPAPGEDMLMAGFPGEQERAL